MAKDQKSPESPLGRLLVTGLIGWALWTWPLATLYDPVLRGLWWFGALMFGIGFAKSLPGLGLSGLGDLIRAIRALSAKDTSKGSAAWLSPREAIRAGLHRRRRGARLAGTLGPVPIHLGSETSQLIIAPSGAGKTSSAMIPLLCDMADGALVSDVKRELYEVTAAYRRRRFGHRIVLIDASNPEASVRVNPVDRVSAALESNDPRALTRAGAIAKQLLPDPKGGAGPNQVFNDGGRLSIKTVILAVCATFKPAHRTLTSVYRVMGDRELLERTLLKAMKVKHLNGEVADVARAMWEAGFGEDRTKTFEQFRLNAQLALELFGPGGHVAQITSETTFSFKELKGKCTCYIVIDFENADVLGKFSGLLQWHAAQEIIELGDNRPVTFCLDEFCNAPLHGIAKILTLARTYGIRCILATQDLDDIERVYGKHVLETVLSECDVAQFLSGIRSAKTLEYLSKQIGETTETQTSVSMGERVQETLARGSRRLMTPDEIRQLPAGAQILFKGNLKPILARAVPVFARAPQRRRIAANSLYGGKRKLMPVEVRARWLGTVVTARGQRLYKCMLREMRRPGGPGRWRMLGQVLRLGALGPALLVVFALGTAVHWQGLPNLRWSYAYEGPARPAPDRFTWCRYVGPTSPGVIAGPICPLILWRKTW